MNPILFLILFLFSFTLHAQSDLSKKAIDSYWKDAYPEAIKLATQAIESNKNDCEALFVRGASYKELDELALAMNDLLVAVKCDSSNYKGVSALAEVYALYGDLEMAIRTYSRSIELNKSYYVNYLDRALCKKESGKYDEAAQDLRIALSLDSTDQEVFGLMGEVHVLLKKYEEAVTYLKKSVELSPNSINNSMLGIAQANFGKYTDAIDSFTRALEFKEANKGLHVYIGQMYMYLEKKTEACQEFETGYKLGDLEGLEFQKKYCK
ncbi:tetratricopeptide repeat protein [Fluviicola sp.]|uniref:tetratricopeptide repeat protein n=1 Tax=Fluviicola sp. TaxID=1917219 RepID=UPI003D2A9D42